MGDTPTIEGFGRPWANRDGARRLVLTLPTPSGGHFNNETYDPFGSDGRHFHQRGREDAHTIRQWGTINVMKVNISVTSELMKIMYTWILITRN